jgi:MATE family multidrug resistance protein
MPLGAGLGLGLGWGPQGMWLGLILGLTAAAISLGWRFNRSSRRLLAAPTPAADEMT